MTMVLGACLLVLLGFLKQEDFPLRILFLSLALLCFLVSSETLFEEGRSSAQEEFEGTPIDELVIGEEYRVLSLTNSSDQKDEDIILCLEIIDNEKILCYQTKEQNIPSNLVIGDKVTMTKQGNLVII